MATETQSILSVGPSSFGTHDVAPYQDSIYTQTPNASTAETTFTDLFKQMGKLWESYINDSEQSGTSSNTLGTYNPRESLLYPSPTSQATYGSLLTQPQSSTSLNFQSALLSAAASSYEQTASVIRQPDEHVVASVRNLGLTRRDLQKHCEEYLSSITPEARADLAAIIGHPGFWSFILKNQTGIGRIETPGDPVNPEVVGELTSAAWTYLHRDQSRSNAQANSIASSSTLPDIAAPSFEDAMPEFPSSDPTSLIDVGLNGSFGKDIPQNGSGLFDLDGEETAEMEEPLVD